MSEPEEARPRAYVCRVCGSAVLDDEHLRDDLEPCFGVTPTCCERYPVTGYHDTDCTVLIAMYPLPGDVLSHRVAIKLRYANEGRTPWKWEGRCTCGWKVLSWQWQRANGSGALPASLEHVGLRHVPSPPHCYEE